MKRIVCFSVLCILLVFCVGILPAEAQSYSVGDNVLLRARNHAGIPLHRRAESSLVGRVADGAIAPIQELMRNDRWLRLAIPDGREGWVTQRYVEEVVNDGTTGGSGSGSSGGVTPVGALTT